MSEFFRKPIVKTLMLKGQEGQSIKGIEKTGTDGFVDTYTITLTDGTTSTFTVTNGKEISSIDKTGTSGLVDTYTITFNDGTNSTFTVTNGKAISSISKTETSGLVDTYTIEFNDGTNSTFTVTNGKAISSISKTETSGLVDTYTIEFNDGTTSTFTVTNGDSAYKPAVYALGKRIDNLILSSGTESSAEVVDARTGYDGTAYTTLGTAIRTQVSNLNDAIIVKKNETFSGKDIDWINGFYGEDGTITPHTLYKHTRVFKVEPETKVTYAYLRSPANFSPYIACFKNGVYIKESSLLGDTDANFKSGEFMIPQDIDGVSFVSYNAPNDERLSISGIFLYYKPDVNDKKIESIETNIQHMESNIAENYNQIYNVKTYTITNGIDIRGSYYDKNGKLNPASNMSTTGIINVPLGIKSIEYTAMRDIDIPTILFFGADMGIVGTVIATTAPVYGDTTYSGYADIPSDAVYMEFSTNNTTDDAKIVVTVSKIDDNQKRIKILEKDPLYGKKITCTGNSITSAVHSVPGHGYVEQIADAHGMTVDNHAIWGAIIPQGHPRASGDITDIGCIHDTLDNMEADADVVIMSGSINDCEYYSDASFLGEITGDFSSELDVTTFYGALEDMCKKALQKWAGKPIIYVIEHRMTLDNTTYGQYYLKLHEAIVKVMNKWGISIVDLFNECPSLNCNEGYKTKYTTGDGTHPNYEGYEKFYVPRVYAEIKKLLGI